MNLLADPYSECLGSMAVLAYADPAAAMAQLVRHTKPLLVGNGADPITQICRGVAKIAESL
jgi:hypothetical protein